MKFTSAASFCILVSAAQHLAGFASASPVAQYPSEDLPPLPHSDTPDASTDPFSEPEGSPSSITLPYRGDGKNLPQPPAGMSLKAVAFGSGEQQYLCKNRKPVPYGAMAELYDPSATLATTAGPSDIASLTDFTSLMLQFPNVLPMKRIGRHYFDARGSPAFNIDAKGFFRGRKTASVEAPKDPDNNRAAVPWLQMTDKGDSHGFKMAYRIATAGGKAPSSCSKNSRIQHIPYAALYYFYG